MVVGGIRQMLSLSPENVNNGRASFGSFRIQCLHDVPLILHLEGECEDVKGVPKVCEGDLS